MSNKLAEHHNVQSSYNPLSIVEKFLLGIFFIHLPFVYALTFDIGFPLKISEVFLTIIIVFFLFKKRLWTIFFDAQLRPYIGISLLFLFFLSISTVVNSFWDYDYKLNLQFFRKNTTVSSYSKLVYTYLAIISSFISYYAFRVNKNWVISCLLIGSTLATVYCWYLFWFSLLKIHYHTLPGSDQFPQAALFHFGHFIRCGTFKEGNHMGLFLLVSGIIAIYQHKNILGYLFLLTTITTASSMAIGTSLLFLGGIFVHSRMQKKQYFQIFASLTLFLIALFILYLKSPDMQYMVSKLIPGKDAFNRDAIFSQQERLNLATSAIAMSNENPFWGIGLTQFSAHYEHFSTGLFPQTNEKMLPNNIYLEILAEAGWFSFLTFLGILIFIGVNLKSTILRYGYIAFLLYLLAYPTFTLLFIWVFKALLLNNATQKQPFN